MNQLIEPLMNDGFDSEPAKRVLRYVEEHKKRGNPIVGIYCGDAPKIFKVIEDAGGVMVATNTCTGMKAFMGDIEEDTSDPILAIAE